MPHDQQPPRGQRSPTSQGDPVERFAHQLLVAKRRAGDLSCRELSRRIARRHADVTTASASSITRAFKGKTLPKWDLVRALLLELDIPGEDLPDWRQMWLAAREQEDPIGIDPSDQPASHPRPRPASTSPGSTFDVGDDNELECSTCGATVSSAGRQLHRNWHDAMSAAGIPSGRASFANGHPRRRICSRCGAVVTDLERHYRWHDMSRI
jgi:hypothetical protein